MDTNKSPGSGASGQDSGAELDKKVEDSSDSSQVKTVKFEDHKRVLDDMHKYKKAVQEQSEKLAEFETKLLEKDQDWKKIAEKYKADAESYKKDLTETKSAFVRTQKFNEVQAKALAAGLRPEAIDDLERIDLDAIEVEVTNTGRMSLNGVDDLVESLKKTKSYWFKTPKAPTVNGGGANGTDGDIKLTPSYMFELEKKDPKKYQETLPKYLAQRRSR